MSQKTSYLLSGFFTGGLLMMGLMGCGGGAGANGAIGTNSKTKSPLSRQAAGQSCVGGDSEHICLGVKYVAYKDSAGNPVVSEAEAGKLITQINKVWDQCNLGFQIDNFAAVDALKEGLNTNPADSGELDTIRSKLSDDSTILVVTTRKWDRAGSLGDTGANAWTAMPGENVYGAILESAVGTFGNIIAHELGHYLNLPHESDQTNLMNPIIYDSSIELSANQCAVARKTADAYWQKMLRK